MDRPGRDFGRGPRCSVWGVLNVTPDSFSDGGLFQSPEAALAQGRALLAQGADVLDVGGESTRPPGRTYGAGYVDVSVEEELARVLPVVEALASEGALVSIDTTKAEVAAAALAAGARIVNDTSGGASPALLAAVARHDATIVLMHNRGRGATQGNTAQYTDVVREVRAELAGAVERARGAGIGAERVWLDPGLGFAKSARDSLLLLSSLPDLVEMGYPVLVGASRKSFLGEAARRPDGSLPPPGERLGASVASCVAAVLAGAAGVRVHDVAVTQQAVRFIESLERAGRSEGGWTS